MPRQQFDEVSLINRSAGFGGSDTPGTYLDIVTVQPGDARIDSLVVWNFDSISHIVDVRLYDGVAQQFQGSATLAAGDGVGNLGSFTDLIAAFRSGVQAFISLPAGQRLQFTVAEGTVDAGVTINAQGGGF